MDRALWYLFVGTRGGGTRADIVKTILNRPRNANQIAEELDINYNTVRYHLDQLEEHSIVEQEQEGYGALFFVSEEFKRYEEEFRQIIEDEL